MTLVRSDPFREMDGFFQQAFGGPGERNWGMREGSSSVAAPRQPEAVRS